VSLEEEMHHSYYFRSQTKHPRSGLFDKAIKTNVEKKGKSLLPRNKAYQKILNDAAEYKHAAKGFLALDNNGFKKTKTLPKDFSSFIIYSGARANNFEINHQATRK